MIDISSMVLDANNNSKTVTNAKCGGYYDAYQGDYGCDYQTKISCDDCKYGAGRKDPEAKCNSL